MGAGALVGTACAAILAVASLPLVGVAVGLVVGAAVAWWLWGAGERMALRALGARSVDDEDEPRLHNVVDGLCAVGGLPKPSLFVVDDAAVNAAALGRDPRRAALVVTSGLLGQLSRIELEGVVARELALVKALGTRVPTVVVPLTFLGPAVTDRLLGDTDPSVADADGAALTRYPPGLLAAFDKLATTPTAVGAGGRRVRHLWMAPVAGPSSLLHARISALREL